MLMSNIVESNGKTVKQNNLEIAHKIPIGSIVEIVCDSGSISYREEMGHGLRLYVVAHNRDCDGSPLYSLSFDLDAWNEFKNLDDIVNANKFESQMEEALIKALWWRAKGALMDGIDEGSLIVIARKDQS